MIKMLTMPRTVKPHQQSLLLLLLFCLLRSRDQVNAKELKQMENFIADRYVMKNMECNFSHNSVRYWKRDNVILKIDLKLDM